MRAVGTATSFITVSFWIGHQEDCFAVFCNWNRDSRSSRGVRFSLAALTVKCYREKVSLDRKGIELPDISETYIEAFTMET